VRNTLEGHVEVLICGEPDAIDSMRQWLAEGPPTARVDSLELARCPDPGLGGFEIRK
jgi:acylphosphatase